MSQEILSQEKEREFLLSILKAVDRDENIRRMLGGEVDGDKIIRDCLVPASEILIYKEGKFLVSRDKFKGKLDSAVREAGGGDELDILEGELQRLHEEMEKILLAVKEKLISLGCMAEII